MKKFLIIFIVAILFFTICFFTLYNKSSKTPLSEFAPFKNGYDKSINLINNNLPKISSASAFYPLASSIVESTYNGNIYNNELSLVSTSEALDQLMSNKTDIAIVTSPSDEQKKLLNYEEIVFVPIAKEALIFYTRTNNDISSLSEEQIKDIYLGNITNWNELGNKKSRKIKTFQLEKGNGSQTSFETIVNNNPIDNKNHFEVNDMGKIIDNAANHNGSIGYAFNSFYTRMHNNKKLKLININEIEPSKENITSGKYPLMFDVYFVYNKYNSNSNIPILLDYLLSSQGQDLIKNNGLQPIEN